MSIDFTPRSCQWLDNQGKFCDIETKINVSWCDHHYSIVFSTTQDTSNEIEIPKDDNGIDQSQALEDLDIELTDEDNEDDAEDDD